VIKYVVLGGHERPTRWRPNDGSKTFGPYRTAREVAEELGLNPAECRLVEAHESMLGINPDRLPVKTMTDVRTKRGEPSPWTA
jgi:hypothetical protein